MTMHARVEAELDNLLVRIGRIAKVDAGVLVRVAHRDRLIVWMPSFRNDSIAISDRHMTERARSMLASLAELKLVGIGLRGGQGPVDWASSIEEALKALKGAERTCAPPLAVITSCRAPPAR